MSLLGTLGIIASTRVGDIMFAPAVSALKIVGGQALGLAGAGITGYGAYKYYVHAKYKTPFAMYMDKHWGDFGLEWEKKSVTGKKYEKPKYIKEEKVTDYLYRAYFKLPIGMAVHDIKSRLPAIELALNAEVDVFRKEGDCILEFSTGHLRYKETYDIRNVLDLPLKEDGSSYILPISIGHSKRGFQWIDLTDYPHLLVGGQTGGGKSVFLRQGLITLLHALPPEKLIMDMIDLKGGLEFKLFNETPHVRGIAKNLYQALDVLNNLEGEMEYRFDLLFNAGPEVEKIATYNELMEKELPYIVLCIDEFAELSPEEVGKDEIDKAPLEYANLLTSLGLYDPDRAKKGQGVTVKLKELLSMIHSKVSRLLRLARAVGIHVILATQRPDAKVLPGQSKQNIPSTVAFKVRNKINSQILLDSDSAAVDIPPGVAGRCIFQIGHIETEVQVPFLSTKEARQLLINLSEDILTYKPDTSTPIEVPAEYYEMEDDLLYGDLEEPIIEETKQTEVG
jgi:DNA segregation ATPase FtsK/SpoIIIE, S-DNA-T family